MRIYIIEDDITVISILEDIVAQNELGTICGDTADAPPDLEGILAADPDLILVDLLMPGKDGIQVVRELKEGGKMCIRDSSSAFRRSISPMCCGW